MKARPPEVADHITPRLYPAKPEHKPRRKPRRDEPFCSSCLKLAATIQYFQICKAANIYETWRGVPTVMCTPSPQIPTIQLDPEISAKVSETTPTRSGAIRQMTSAFAKRLNQQMLWMQRGQGNCMTKSKAISPDDRESSSLSACIYGSRCESVH